MTPLFRSEVGIYYLSVPLVSKGTYA